MVLLLLSAGAALSAPVAEVPAITREYATTYGPIALTFRGNAVDGRYRISVKPNPDEGSIQGTIQHGLLDARWSEPGSGGRMLVAFSADFSRLHIIYTVDRNPGHWLGEWTGVSKEQFESLPADAKRRLRSDW